MKIFSLFAKVAFYFTSLLLVAGFALGQTNPTPQTLPYSQDFSGLTHASTTYPAGWQGWTISTSPGASFNTSAPTADRALVASSTAATNSGNVHNFNGKIGFLNNNSLDLSLVLSLNTTGKRNIHVNYSIMTIRNPYDGGTNTRINEVTLQYRIGNTGSFTNITDIEYQNNTTTQTTAVTTPQNPESRGFYLPAECNDRPEVQIRWASRQISGGGARPSFAVDDVSITGNDTYVPGVLTYNRWSIPDYELTHSTASVGGDVYDSGGGQITERGVYWGTDENPETNGTKLQIGSGTGEFFSTLSDLNPSTTYFYRAYATNSAGTSYGDLVYFVTPAYVAFTSPTSLNSYTIGTDNNIEILINHNFNWPVSGNIYLVCNDLFQYINGFNGEGNNIYSFNYNINPNLLTGQYKIVLQYFDQGIGDNISLVSDEFTITNPNISIDITSPVAGQTYELGVNGIVPITVVSTRIEEFDASFSLIGQNYQYAFTPQIKVEESPFTYNYSIPSTLDGGTYSIRMNITIMDNGNSTNGQQSSGDFTVVNNTKEIEVTYPKLNEYFVSGSAGTIRWNSSNVSLVNISYSIDNGESWTSIVIDYSTSNGYQVDGYNAYWWDVPTSIVETYHQCLIKIEDADGVASAVITPAFTISDEPMIRFITPQPNDEFTVTDETFIPIEMKYNGLREANHSLWLGASQLKSWVVSEPSTLTHSLNISTVLSGTYQLVQQLSFTEYSGWGSESSGDIIVNNTTQNIELKSPSENLFWVKGNTYEIRWNSINLNSVDLFYSTDDGLTWNPIAQDVYTSDGYSTWGNNSYYWNIQESIEGVNRNSYIKIVGQSGAVERISKKFTLSESRLTEFIEPIAGLTFTVGVDEVIPVRVKKEGWYNSTDLLVLEVGDELVIIRQFEVGDGEVEYSYQIPQTLPSGNYRFIYNWTFNSFDNPNAVSEYFAIVNPTQSIEVGSPSLNHYLMAGAEYELSWNSNNVSNVNISYSLNNGTSWEVIASNIATNNGYHPQGYNKYEWQVPTGITGTHRECLIRVEDTGSSISAISQVFTLSDEPILKFVSPLVNETYTVGLDNHIPVEVVYNGSGPNRIDLSFWKVSSGQNIKQWNVDGPIALTYNHMINSDIISGKYNYETWCNGSNSFFSGEITIVNPSKKLEFISPPAMASYDYCADRDIEIEIETLGLGELYGSLYFVEWWNYIDQFYSPGDGTTSYTFTIPNWVGPGSYRFRLDTDAGNVYSEYFNITANTTVSFSLPAENQEYVVGVDESIPVELVLNGCLDRSGTLYLENNGQLIVVENVTINEENPLFQMNYPIQQGMLSGEYRFVYKYYNNQANQDESVYGNSFTVVNSNVSISFLSPLAGQTYEVGVDDTLPIIFEHQGIGGFSGSIYLNSGNASTSIHGDWISESNSPYTFVYSLPSTFPSGVYQVALNYNNYNNISGVAYSDEFNIINNNKVIEIVSPSFGVYCETGNTYSIQWNSSNITQVNLFYSTDNGASWHDIANNVVSNSSYSSSGNNTYWFNVPGSITGINYQSLIRIDDVDGIAPSAYSEYFTLADEPFAYFLSPCEEQTFDASLQTSIPVEIRYNGNGPVELTLHIMNFVDWGWSQIEIISSESAFTFQHNFDFTTLPSGNYQFVFSLNMPNYCCPAYFGNTFTVINNEQNIDLAQPQEGVFVMIGSWIDIRWNSVNLSEVNLYYSLNDGVNWLPLASNVSANNGWENNGYNVYSWNVPVSITGTNRQSRIKIEGVGSAVEAISQRFIISDSPLIDFIEPAEDLTFTVGVNELIPVRINKQGWGWREHSLYIETPGGGQFVKYFYEADGILQYNYPIPPTLSSGVYRFYLVDLWNNNEIVAYSNYFNVVNPNTAIEVIQPTTDYCLTKGTDYSIRWNTLNVSSVNIYYSVNDGDDWLTIASNVPVTDGSDIYGYHIYDWFVPTDIIGSPNSCLVKIEDALGSNESISGVFRIRDADVIQFTSPLAGSEYVVGTHSTIPVVVTMQGCGGYWGDFFFGNTDNWQYQYMQPGFSEGNPFEYNFEISPLTPTGQYRFRLYNGSIEVISDEFTITNSNQQISVDSPGNNQYLEVGNTYDINWSSVNISEVNINYSIDNGASWEPIASSISSNDGANSLSWEVPAIITGTYRECLVKVSNTAGDIMDISDTFTISDQPIIRFTSPLHTDIYTIGVDDEIPVEIIYNGTGPADFYLYFINGYDWVYVSYFYVSGHETVNYNYSIPEDIITGNYKLVLGSPYFINSDEFRVENPSRKLEFVSPIASSEYDVCGDPIDISIEMLGLGETYGYFYLYDENDYVLQAGYYYASEEGITTFEFETPTYLNEGSYHFRLESNFGLIVSPTFTITNSNRAVFSLPLAGQTYEVGVDSQIPAELNLDGCIDICGGFYIIVNDDEWWQLSYVCLDESNPTYTINYNLSFNIPSGTHRFAFTDLTNTYYSEYFTVINEPFEGGDGTEGNPYLIANAEQLNRVRYFQDSHFLQVADIDLGVAPWNEGEGWLPIGDGYNPFMGQYNGNGYKINNLTINRSDNFNVGLFGYANYFVIKNLNIENANVQGGDRTGILIGYSNFGEVQGCSVSGNVTGAYNVGGIAGFAYVSNYDNCSASVNVSGQYFSGGLVGSMENGYTDINSTIANCHAQGVVNITQSTAGGLAGLIGGNVQVTGCWADVEVSALSDVGGFAGTIYDGVNVTQSYALGSATAQNSSAGGFAGYIGVNTTIDRCFAAGDATANSYTGGFVGYSYSNTISNSYAVGNSYGTGENSGGFTGWSNTCEFINVYSQGTATANSYKGGLVGNIYLSSVTSSYWNKETSGMNTSAGGEGKTIAQMVAQTTFNNWDFTDVWQIEEGSSYPYLKWQGSPSDFNIPPTVVAPSNLSAVPGDGSVTLSWEAPTFGTYTGYYIYRDGVKIGESLTESFTESGLTNYQIYSYYVSTVNGLVESTPSVAIEVYVFPGFDGGDGSVGNPFQIATAHQLNAVRYYLTANFIQVANISLADPQWYDGDGWLPIGDSNNKFTGTYNGNGYIISDLKIIRTQTDNIGLFGHILNAEIDNLSLANVYVSGKIKVGAFAGTSENSSILNCHSTGSVNATQAAGGLIGWVLRGTVSQSSSSVAVASESYAGGLTGILEDNVTLSLNYSSGSATGVFAIGGLTGYMYSSCTISNSYSTTLVVGDNATAGFATASSNCFITNSYAVGKVTGNQTVGGLIPSNQTLSATSSYWNVETTSCSTSGAGAGKNTLQLISQSTFDGWDFADIWAIQEGTTYPYLKWQVNPSDINHPNTSAIPPSGLTATNSETSVNLSWNPPSIGTPSEYRIYRDDMFLASTSNLVYSDASVVEYTIYKYNVTAVYGTDETESSNTVEIYYFRGFDGGDGTPDNPYLISKAGQLFAVRYYLTSHFMQVADIDLGVAPWNQGSGWNPIGTSATPFRGTYNGDGFTISNLTINRSSQYYVGLFGYTNSAQFSNMVINQASILGYGSVGIIAGYAQAGGLIVANRCHVEGNVSGILGVGGLFGNVINGTISTSSSYANVTGNNQQGGLVGNYQHGTIRDCYTRGSVNGAISGGLIGQLNNITIENSYSATQITGINSLGGLVGSGWNYPTVVSSYWDMSISGINYTFGDGVGSTTSDMTFPYSQSVYNDWNFSTTWKADTDYSVNDGYPYHRWMIKYVEIDEPFANSVLRGGDQVNIRWRSNKVTEVNIYYSINDGSTWMPIELAVVSQDENNSYQWVVPYIDGTYSQSRIKVEETGEGVLSISDRFTITSKVLLTLNLDMSNAELNDNGSMIPFNPALHRVFVSGEFNGWAKPGSDNMYELTNMPNTLSESWENYDDFTTTLSPWTTLQLTSGATWNSGHCDFPGEGTAFAFMAFNPSQTDPPIVDNHPAQHGDKYAIAIQYLGENDNKWLISPELRGTSTSQLSFYAKSYTHAYGAERIRVLISTTDNNPASFSKISEGDYIEVPTGWTRYEYDLSNLAGETYYFAIQYLSYDAFVFMLDNIQVTSSSESSDPYSLTLEVEKGNYDYKYYIVKNNPTWDYPEWDNSYYNRNVVVTGNMEQDDVWGQGGVIKTYTIAASAGENGSISPSGVVTVNHGSTQSFTFTPNLGYRVADVLVDGQSVGALNSYEFVNVTQNHTIDVAFEISTYTITASAGLNGNISPSGAIVLNYGANQEFSISPNQGYYIVSVLVDGVDVGAVSTYTFTNVTNDHTIEVSFAIYTFNLSYSAGAGGSISGSASQTVNYGANGTAVTAAPNTGYHFVKWSDDKTDNPRTDVNVTSSISVTAIFAINTYPVTFSVSGGNGTLSATANSEAITSGNSVEHGKTIVFTAAPNTVYKVKLWTVNGAPITGYSANTYTIASLQAAVIVSVEFEIITYTLTYTAGVGGYLSGNPSQTVNHGASGTAVMATAGPGYHFVKWSDDVTANPRTDANVTANISVTAQFAINMYTISATTGENGVISPAGVSEISYGGSKTYTITPNEGYRVQSVLIDGVSAGSITSYTFENVQANHTIHSNFVLRSYNIGVAASPVAGGSVIGSGTYNHFASATVEATANANYTFVGWIEDGATVSTNPQYTFPVNRARNLVANFALNDQYTVTLSRNPIEGGTVSGGGSYFQNVPVSVTATPAVGYDFTGWTGYGATTDNPYNFNMPGENVSFTANFTIKTYSITATAGANGSLSPAGVTTVNHGSSQTYTITPDVGYQVQRVMVNGVNQGALTSYTFSNVTSSQTISAEFTPVTYTITASADTGGTISPSGNVIVAHGANQTFNITPIEGYDIADVLVDGSSVGALASYTFNSVNTGHTIAASFAKKTYTITATAGANGSITPSGAQSVDHGSSITFTILPSGGYHIASVEVDGISVGVPSSYTFNSVSAGHTIHAEFALTPPTIHTISASAGANGAISPTGNVNVVAGGNITFTITANTGYHIDDVLVNGTSVGNVSTYQFTNVLASHTIAATFAINTYTLTYAAGANGSISGTASQTVNHGANGAAVTAVPSTGYHFVQWSDGSNINPRTDANVTSNVNVTAQFALNSYTISVSAIPALGGNVTGGGVYDHNAAVTVVASAQANYQFANWTESGATVSTSASYTFNASANRTLVANFIEEGQYTVTIARIPVAGGTVTGGCSYYAGDQVTLNATPGTGYNFTGWTGYLTETSSPHTFTMPAQNVEIDANFTLKTYTISATATSGGTITPSGNVQVTHGGSQTFTIATGAGHSLTDVQVDGVSEGAITSRTFTNVSSSRTIHAVFTPYTYTLVYSAGANGSISGTATQTVNYSGNGTAVTAVPATGYRFVQWSDGITANPRTDTNVMADITVTAQFAINTYPVTFSVTGTNGTLAASVDGSAITSGAVVEHGKSVVFTATPAKGYRVKAWTLNSTVISGNTTNTYTLSSLASAPTVTVEFEVITYTITYTAGTGGSITGTNPQTVNHGANGTAVTAVPNVGYHFVKWSDEVTTATRTDANVTANITVTAQFAINTYTLTYAAGTGGSITGTSPQTVNHGASGTAVTAVPNTGYHFVKWSDDVTTASRTDANVTANITVTAQFAINAYTLTYTAGAGGTITGTSPQTVNHGANGTAVTAVPNTGYHFVKWSDDLITATRTDVNVTANITVEAQFSINTYMLTLEVSPDNSGTVTGAGTYQEGHNVTITATAAEGYQFLNWRYEGAVISDQTTFTYVMPAQNVTLVAHFVEESAETYTLTLVANPINGGLVIGGGEFAEGDLVTVAAQPNDGYIFVNWIDSQGNVISSTTIFIYTMPAADVTLTANFEVEQLETFIVTFTVTDNQGNAVDAANIAIDGVDDELETDEDGVATITLSDGTYTYTVTANGFITSNGTFIVNGEDISVDVELITVGIETSTLSNIDVYPNPFHSSITLSNANRASRVVISNLIGQKVMEIKLTGSDRETILTDGLVNGIYLIQIYSESGERLVKKMIKE